MEIRMNVTAIGAHMERDKDTTLRHAAVGSG